MPPQTSIASTGTISIIAGTGSSIEPLFALVLRHLARLGQDTAKRMDLIASTGFLDLDGETKNLFHTP